MGNYAKFIVITIVTCNFYAHLSGHFVNVLQVQFFFKYTFKIQSKLNAIHLSTLLSQGMYTKWLKMVHFIRVMVMVKPFLINHKEEN